MALRDIGADFEHYRLVEFDKYAVASYNAIHGTSFETADIRNVHGADLGIVDCDKYTYIMTYSFPCTDLSVAGKMRGMSKAKWEQGNSTRSGLLWEVERILKELPEDELPQVLLMENVPQVHAEKNSIDFENWCSFLRSKGYYNYFKDLNAKDFGIPQNRERCFMVSILSDDFIDFEFPKPIELETVIKDFLEEEVDEKYYINNEKSQKLIAQLIESGALPTDNRQQTTDNRQDKTRQSNETNYPCQDMPKRIGNLYGDDKGTGFAGNVWNKNAISPTITTCQGGGREPMILDSFIVAMRGRNPEHPTDRTPGIHTEQRLETKYRIRKLTPLECWRLMGYTDEDFEKAKTAGVSNSQLYKQAGNAIAKQVLIAIFSQMNIKGVKVWNDMTETEKRDIIKKTTMAAELTKVFEESDEQTAINNA